jgi:integrase
MTTTTPESAPAVLVPVADPLFTVAERQALAGFLSGYSGLTRGAYTLDLRQYTAGCTLHGLHLFAAKRADIESFRGDMEAAGRARATIARRLCTIAGFYRYAVEEELLDHSPAAHLRRPRLDYESHATALEATSWVRSWSRPGSVRRRSTRSIAAGAQRTADQKPSAPTFRRWAASAGTAPSPCSARAARSSRSRWRRAPPEVSTWPSGNGSRGPIFRRADRQRLDRHGAGRIVRRIAKRAGIAKPISPHTLRHAFITAALDAGVPLRDVQEAASHADPRTTMRYDRARASLDRHATYIVAAYLAGAAR